MPIGPARMPLMEHLGELRMRLVRIVVVLIVAICVFYFATPTVSQFLLAPVSEFLPPDEQGLAQLTVLDPFEGFSVRFNIALWTAVVATSPVILWQLLAFFLPALRPSERKWFIPTFAAAVALFILGTVFCYLVILNPAFEWLTNQANGFASITARASSYIDIIIKFEIGFGFAFELPLIVFYLVIFNIVPYYKMRRAWRWIYVGLMVISASVTPDANPVTMLMLFVVLIVLYELSLLLARIVLRNKIKKQREQAQADGDYYDEDKVNKMRASLGEIELDDEGNIIEQDRPGRKRKRA